MKTITAVEQYGTPYMTQADENVKKRAYCKRITGNKVDETQWRGATAEERDEWVKQRENARKQTQ